jgi:hypothetical protein
MSGNIAESGVKHQKSINHSSYDAFEHLEVC